MFFSASYGSCINLDHLLRIDQAGKDDQGQRVYRGAMTGGSEVRLDAADVRCIEAITQPVIPARPGDSAIVVLWYGEGERPEYEVHDVAVVGWRFDGEGVVPLLVDEVGTDERVGVPMPDGRVRVPCVSIWDS